MELKKSQNKQLTKEQLKKIKGGTKGGTSVKTGGHPFKNTAKCVLSLFTKC